MSNRSFLRGVAALRRSFVKPTSFVPAPAGSYLVNSWGDRVAVSGAIMVGENPLDNMEKLGSGAFSSVYVIDDTRVLKVSRGIDNGYAAFVKVCRENPDCKHLPRIYYEGVWNGNAVYVLERLNRCQSHDETDHLINAIGFFCGRTNPFVQLICPELQRLAKLLQRDEGGPGWIDLKYDNIMQREDGTYVVTDPWAH